MPSFVEKQVLLGLLERVDSPWGVFLLKSSASSRSPSLGKSLSELELWSALSQASVKLNCPEGVLVQDLDHSPHAVVEFVREAAVYY